MGEFTTTEHDFVLNKTAGGRTIVFGFWMDVTYMIGLSPRYPCYKSFKQMCSKQGCSGPPHRTSLWSELAFYGKESATSNRTFCIMNWLTRLGHRSLTPKPSSLAFLNVEVKCLDKGCKAGKFEEPLEEALALRDIKV